MPEHDRPLASTPLARAVELHPALACCVAAVAAVFVKHPGIASRSLWLDEAWTAAVGAHGSAAILTIAAHDQNPPLYNLLVAWWARAFGTSELALRMPSLLAAVACAALLLRFVRRFYGAEAAVTATLLYLVAPAQTWYATEARSYALVGLLCVVSFHLYLSLLETPRRATAVALGLVNAAGLYAHYTIGLAWLAQAVCAPLVARAGGGRPALRAWIGSQVLAAALFVPLAPCVVANLPARTTSWLPPPGLTELAQVVRELAGSRSALRAGALLVAGFAVSRSFRWRRDGAPTLADRRVVAALAWAVIPVTVAFVVSQATPILLTRYQLFAGLGWIVAVAAVVAALPWPPLVRTAVALGMVFLSAKSTPYEASRDPAWRAVAALARPTPDDPTMLAVVPAVDCIPLAYYAARDVLPTLFGPRGTWQPAGLHRRLAARRILCRDGEWPAWRVDLDGARVVLVLSRPSTDDAARALRHAAERGYVVESSRELAGKQIHLLVRRAEASKGASP